MADLRATPERMAEYLAHLRERESVVPYFYCDSEGLVTIAIGFLVDQRGGNDTVGKGLARTLAGRGDVTFRTTAGNQVGATEVESDWKKVKDYGRANPSAGAASFRGVGGLRIDDVSIRMLAQTKVHKFCGDLYKKRPFMVSFDAWATMAFVDVLYNPAGVVLFGTSPDVSAMWRALDPASRKFDPNQAVLLFEQIWARRATVRYAQRHFIRVQWLRAALEGALQSA